MIQVPGFEIIEKIASGGATEAWKAHQVSLDRTVIIHVLREQTASDPREVEAFVRQARAIARLKHPNLIQVYDVSEQDGKHYFVCEHVEGSTVGRIIAEKGCLSQKRALRIAATVAEALECAWHTAHVVHRNVKPDNIIVDANQAVKIADFSMARVYHPGSTDAYADSGLIEGTPNYMAPEQIKGNATLDCRTDMYSFGATLYHMVTGRLPFGDADGETAMRRQVSGHLPNPRQVRPSVSLGMSQLITRLMMKAPENRYRTWNDVLKTLAKISSGGVLLEKPTTDNLSTVAPATPQRRARPAGAAPTRATTGARVPAGVHIVAWALVLTWWTLLSAYLLELPPFGRQRDAVDPPGTAQGTPLPAPAEREASPPRGRAETGDPARTAAAQLGALADDVAAMLAAEDFTAARARVSGAEPAPAGSEEAEIGALVAEISQMETALRSAFQDRVGQEVGIYHRDQNHTIVIRSVIEDEVRADLVSGTDTARQSRPIVFAISKLDPVELSRWLGKADSPARAAMKCILHMKAGDAASAAEFAGQCGPLADAFARLAAAASSQDR